MEAESGPDLPIEEQKEEEQPRSSLERLRSERFDLLTEVATLKRKLEEVDKDIDGRLEKIDSVLMDTKKRSKLFANPESETSYRELKLILEDSAKKNKVRATFDRDFKLKISNLARIEGRQPVLANLPQISESCLSKWMSTDWVNEPPLRDRGRPISNPEFDEHLRNIILVLRQNNVVLSARLLILNAKKLAIKRGIIGLKFSWGWLQKFLKRHHFAVRRSSRNTKYPENLISEQSVEFAKKIQSLIINGDYKRKNILNMDETGVYRDSPYKSVIDIKGKKNVKIITGGHEKNRVTYVPTVTMSGEELTALILLPGKGIRNKLSIILPDNLKVIYTGANSAWMDQSIMSEEYVNEVLKPFSKTLEPNERALLLVDNVSAHKDSGFISKAKALGVDVEFLPPNTTSKLQPLDLSYNSAFKVHYSTLWEKWFMENCLDKVTSFIPDRPNVNVNDPPIEGEFEIIANKNELVNKKEDLELKLSLSKLPSPNWDEMVTLIKKARERIDQPTISAGFKIYEENGLISNKNVIVKSHHTLTLNKQQQTDILHEWASITPTGLLTATSVLDLDNESDETWTPPSNLEELLDMSIDMD